MRIGLDVMGGDFAPSATIKGAVLALQELENTATLVLIGDESKIKAELVLENVDSNKFEIVHAPDLIGMGEHPTKAFVKKPKSSISIGFHLMKEGLIDGFASAGNSGAMLVGAFYTIKSITGVIRPSITSILPKENGGVGLLLDVGINADCKPDVLNQFAILGSLYAEHVHGISNPKVALLNIGEEEGKGNLLTQVAYNLMKDSEEFNFVGNVEGRDLFNESADVIVCDGFTGNIVLKQAEAFYALTKKRGIKDEYFDRFNYENYGGTAILGVNGTVMIGHGISNAKAIKNMLLHTAEVIDAKLSDKIKIAFQG
ncbi:MAG: phosphate acyltransferase PlsX [Flavobacteriales bacterium]|jgi:glycerol-3-phosphate acyltransferase PlsX|tara:strand:- start:2945 stop:3886 length:942 start_codon:yes stop_codon:yes gene_type:complete